MKTLVLLISFTFSLHQTIAQIVTIPDANFKAALVGNDEINTNSDDEIQLTEAQTFNLSIDVSNLSITSLIGIEAFENITVLDCSNNAISDLDLSGNFELMILQCQNNQIESIDLTANTNLNMMLCNNNLLSSIDVSQNTSLTMLACDSNQLSSLDVSVNTQLNSLSCSNNNITSLDFTQNTAITELNLAINQLTNLDVRNGTNEIITDFISSYNPNLSCVFVDDATFSTSNWTNIDAASTFVETEMACDHLATEALEITALAIYPNPCTEVLTIEMETPLKNASIYNIQGQEEIISTTKNINVSNLSPGYYIIKVENEVGRIAIKSFVKK